MNVITDKQSKNYEYVSRYAALDYLYHSKDDKYFYELGYQIAHNINYKVHTVQPNDTLDSISNYYYGRPDYYWVIADFNLIQDPFIRLFDEYTELAIPPLTQISYKRQ